MNILLAFAGSRGDAQPGVLIGSELARRGHRVTVAVSPNLVEFARRQGIRAVPFGLDSDDLLRAQRDDRRFTHPNPVQRVRAVLDLQRRGFAEAARDLHDLARDNDVLVTGMACEEVATEVARHHAIPLTALHFFPIHATRAIPVIPAPWGHHIPGPLNRLAWQTLAKARAWSLAAEITAHRRTVGMHDHADAQPGETWSATVVPGPAELASRAARSMKRDRLAARASGSPAETMTLARRAMNSSDPTTAWELRDRSAFRNIDDDVLAASAGCEADQAADRGGLLSLTLVPGGANHAPDAGSQGASTPASKRRVPGTHLHSESAGASAADPNLAQESMGRNVIHAYDPGLFPGLADELPGAIFTGFPVVPVGSVPVGATVVGAVDAQQGRLDEWLREGAAPVYAGFGSMPISDPEATESMVREVGRRLGLRVLLVGGMFRARITAELAVVAQVDHQAVLPRCAVAVHHGGAGTTAAVLRAGVPGVICSVQADQPYWGRQLHELGLGATAPFAGLDANRLECLLIQATEPAVVTRAADYGARFRDDGVRRAADAIESMTTLGGVR
ncbi:nucleotide disphospho-sugar-binding domain-containing protein [Nocardia sp. NBC_00511]|uniref:nucleotide disphospho-sugar-binding domain-containing protein n=1 Tax=Nocardia sp. NBC_00511 TaxID=2903591 RepID=UPI0030E20FF5